jgi:lipopolysaccharide biosynthesis regulator YciM
VKKNKGGRPRKAPDDASLTDVQLRGASIEAEAWPAELTEGQLALRAGVSQQAVSKWRHNPHYLQAVEEALAQCISKKVQAQMEEHEAVAEAHEANLPPRGRRLENLEVDARNDWQGPTKCIVCGEVFSDPGSYVNHIKLKHPDVGYGHN